jgi:hypothetical protein
VECTCENVALSAHGLIAHSETIVRVVLSPRHLDKNGNLKPGLFPPSHIVQKGLSLTRSDKVSPDELRRIAFEVASTLEDQTPYGLSYSRADKLRVLNDNRRELCLFDDPVTVAHGGFENSAHALLISTTKETIDYLSNQPGPHALKLQDLVMQAFSDPVKL